MKRALDSPVSMPVPYEDLLKSMTADNLVAEVLYWQRRYFELEQQHRYDEQRYDL